MASRTNDPETPPKQPKKVRLVHKFTVLKSGQVTMISEQVSELISTDDKASNWVLANLGVIIKDVSSFM